MRWSADDGDNDAANITVPTATQQNTGWTLGQKPSSGLFNWLANRSYRWFKWLSDGDCLFHNLTANSTLTLTGTGATTLGGALTVTGKTTLSNTLGVGGNATLAGTLSVTGNSAIGGTLTVTGNTTLSGTLGVTGNVTLGGTTGTTVSGSSNGMTIGGQPLTFTNFTFTADATTDQLTATANGLLSGDGPVRISTSGTMPGGLAAGTDYYWVNIDANHGKLATSRTNALLGVAIDVTSNGIGTQTLQQQTSTTRASDLRVTRDLTVDGTFYRTKPYKRTFLPNIYLGPWQPIAGISGTRNFLAYKQAATGGTSYFHIPFEDGERLIGLSFQATLAATNGPGDIEWGVYYYPSNAAAEAAVFDSSTGLISALNPGFVTPSNTWSAFDIQITPTALSAGGVLSVILTFDENGALMGQWTATFDRPHP